MIKWNEIEKKNKVLFDYDKSWQDQVCYPIEFMSQFKHKLRVQSQFVSPKYIPNRVNYVCTCPVETLHMLS